VEPPGFDRKTLYCRIAPMWAANATHPDTGIATWREAPPQSSKPIPGCRFPGPRAWRCDVACSCLLLYPRRSPTAAARNPCTKTLGPAAACGPAPLLLAGETLPPVPPRWDPAVPGDADLPFRPAPKTNKGDGHATFRLHEGRMPDRCDNSCRVHEIDFEEIPGHPPRRRGARAARSASVRRV